MRSPGGHSLDPFGTDRDRGPPDVDGGSVGGHHRVGAETDAGTGLVAAFRSSHRSGWRHRGSRPRRRCRPFVHVGGRPHLLDGSGAHDGQAVLSSTWSALRSLASRASRAPSGSSNSSTCGSSIRARASATRCCRPPDSWTGRRAWNSDIWTSSRADPTFTAVSVFEESRSEDRSRRSRPPRGGGTGRALEDGVDGAEVGGIWAMSTPSRSGPRWAVSNPATIRKVVVLPATRRAQQREELPGPISRPMVSTATKSSNDLHRPTKRTCPPATGQPIRAARLRRQRRSPRSGRRRRWCAEPTPSTARPCSTAAGRHRG